MKLLPTKNQNKTKNDKAREKVEKKFNINEYI